MPPVDFHDITFPVKFLHGARVKIKYKTQIIRMREGYEERIGEWQDALREFNVTPGIRNQDDLDEVLSFFHARGGPQYAYKIYDPTDFEVVENFFGAGNGSRTSWQLVAYYQTGLTGDTGNTCIRPITLPDDPVHIFVDGTETFDFGVNVTTGVVTFSSPPSNGAVLTWSGTFQVPVRF